MEALEGNIREIVLKELLEHLNGEDVSIDEIDNDCNMIGTGLIDSLGFLSLLASIEKEFDIQVDFSGLDPSEFTTIKGLVEQCVRLINLQKEHK